MFVRLEHINYQRDIKKNLTGKLFEKFAILFYFIIV